MSLDIPVGRQTVSGKACSELTGGRGGLPEEVTPGGRGGNTQAEGGGGALGGAKAGTWGGSGFAQGGGWSPGRGGGMGGGPAWPCWEHGCFCRDPRGSPPCRGVSPLRPRGEGQDTLLWSPPCRGRHRPRLGPPSAGASSRGLCRPHTCRLWSRCLSQGDSADCCVCHRVPPRRALLAVLPRTRSPAPLITVSGSEHTDKSPERMLTTLSLARHHQP